MKRIYSLAVLACFATSACYADDMTTFDLAAYVGPFTTMYGPPIPIEMVDFDGTLTYDLDTGQLVSFDIGGVADWPSPYVTVALAPTYGQAGTFEFIINSGPLGDENPQNYWPFTFSIGAALDSETVIPVTNVNYVQYDSGPYSCGYCFPADAPRGGTLTQEAQAPEIDPGVAGSALTLLAGALAMVRGRKRSA